MYWEGSEPVSWGCALRIELQLIMIHELGK